MNFAYVSEYGSPNLRGRDNPERPRPWNLAYKIILHANANQNNKLLDIGCGTSIKLTPLVPYFSEIIALDISESMLHASKKLIDDYHIKNIQLIQGNSFYLPFLDNSFDMVTCMLSNWTIPEIARILKPNGVLIAEHIGCEDKVAFKKFFGKDIHGWRGQFLNYNKNEFLNNFHKTLTEYFKVVSVSNGFWETFYTREGLLELLNFTPTIRNFDFQKDIEYLNKAINQHNTINGILLTQNRVLIYAKNIRSKSIFKK